MSIYALRQLKRFLKNNFPRQIELKLNPAVADEVLRDKESLKFMERKFKTRINVISDPALHLEDIRIS
jgi:hypothetical protein